MLLKLDKVVVNSDYIAAIVPAMVTPMPPLGMTLPPQEPVPGCVIQCVGSPNGFGIGLTIDEVLQEIELVTQ